MRPATHRRSGPRTSPTWPPCSCSRGSRAVPRHGGGRTARWMSGSGTPRPRPTGSSYADVDTAYPNMAVDLYPFEKPGDGPAPIPPTPAAGVPHRLGGRQPAVRPDPLLPGSNLQAKGFGSLTMRPRTRRWSGRTDSWRGRPLDGRPAPAAAGRRPKPAWRIGPGRSAVDRLRPLGRGGARPQRPEAGLDLARPRSGIDRGAARLARIGR